MYLILVTLSLILVFGSSAFMSISGLLSIFTNNTIIIICMGLGMEIGKILTISHLYRSWYKNNIVAKTWYIVIVFILTFLTSFEVMGFLSQCHQKAVQGNHIIQTKIIELNKKESILRSQIKMIDTTLEGLPKTHVTRRIRERKIAGYGDKQKKLIEIIEQKANLEAQLISEKKNSNPVAATAKVFKMDDSDIISIFIPLLVLILEPLAIGLTIAANSAWMNLTKDNCQTSATQNNFSNNPNLTKELQSIQKEYNLSISKIAKITGRKKLKTCEGWLKGVIPTPPRALADVQAWVVEEYVKKPDG